MSCAKCAAMRARIAKALAKLAKKKKSGDAK